MVVAARGVLLVVVVVVVVVVETVVEVVVVVFAMVVFAVFTRCGRSYADKQREELRGTYWGGLVSVQASLHTREAAAAAAAGLNW